MFQVNSGTAGDDAYTGGAGSIYGRFINTLDGNDTVQVQSSVDSVDLGSGNDVLGVAGPTLVFGAAINTVGGIGTDTIRLDTAATYNLLNILNLSGFEKIDMAPAATVEPLGLTLDMVQGMTAGNTVANLLRIDGGTNDVLNLNAAGITAATVAVGNAFFNDVTIAGQTYDVARYTHNGQQVTLLIDVEMKNAVTGDLPLAPNFTDASNVAVTTATRNLAENSQGEMAFDAGEYLNQTYGQSYSLSGADAGKFLIDNTGKLYANAAMNFEAPSVAGANGVYDLTVTATNAYGSDTLGVSLTLKDVLQESTAGQGVINLGAGNGQLINGVQVDGQWYYFWDKNGNGVAEGGDIGTHDAVDTLLGVETTDTTRTGTVNGVQLALPKAGGVAGTLADKGSYTDLAEIWDNANNGIATGSPTGWVNANYNSATSVDATHHYFVGTVAGVVGSVLDNSATQYTVFQVL